MDGISRAIDIAQDAGGDTPGIGLMIPHQGCEGLVIARKAGNKGTFVVRKMSFGHGVERIFPAHCRVIDKVEVVRSAKVRRAKLYYLRALRGKAARLREVEQ